MIKFVQRFALLATLVFALTAFLMRAQPYHDRARQALINNNCATPCLMGIRPGQTTMRGAVSIIESHDWVAPGVGFPALVRNAVFYDAAVPRTHLEWRWSASAPSWLNSVQRGQLTLENREVRDVTIDTTLAFGEIVLAFGKPDADQFTYSTSALGRHFEYNGWYARLGITVAVEGSCPLSNYYGIPVRILFRPPATQLSNAITQSFVCS